MHYANAASATDRWLNFTTVLNCRPSELDLELESDPGQVATKREEAISLEGDRLVAIRLLEPVVNLGTFKQP